MATKKARSTKTPRLGARRQPETLRLRTLTPSFTATDLQRSIAFYRDVLGFVVGDEWRENGTLAGCEIHAGAVTIPMLPGPADRAELDLLLRLLDVAAVNLLLSGIPKPFTRMSRAQRERCLRSWATSAIPQRRKAFQALKRLTTVVHYTTPVVARAIGYPGPLGPPPNTPKPIRPTLVTADTTLSCDVVVVGSGAGGGVVAGELTAAGKDVIVLEKGGYRNEADFTHQEGDALATMYDAGGLLATRDLDLVVLQVSTLGGGTVINYTTSFPTPDAVRHEWAI